jgi:hypothetical protein
MFAPQSSHMLERLPRADESAAQRNERRRYFAIYGSIFLGSVIALTAGFLIEESHFLLNVFDTHSDRAQSLNKLLAHFLNEAGLAGLIACGLAVTIERFSTKEFVKHAQKLAAEEREAIKSDVFHATFGHFVPKAIINELTSQVLIETFLRKNFLMIYTLRPFVDVVTHSTYVLVEFKMQYDIVNLSPYRRPFILKAAFSKPPLASLQDQAKFLHISAEGCEEPFTLEEDKIKVFARAGSYISLNHEEPLWVKPGEDQATTITIHSQTVKHFAGGSSFFSVEYPTADLELTALVYDRTLDVYSGATPVSPDFDWMKETPRHQPQYGHYNWKLQRPLLAFQAIYLTWNPKELITVEQSPE